jgi:hypothetical protein
MDAPEAGALHVATRIMQITAAGNRYDGPMARAPELPGYNLVQDLPGSTILFITLFICPPLLVGSIVDASPRRCFLPFF